MTRIGLTSGRYQPPHNSHLEVFNRMFELFDVVYVSVMHNPTLSRENPFYTNEVIEMIKKINPNLRVITHSNKPFGALIDFLKIHKSINPVYYTREPFWAFWTNLMGYKVIKEGRNGISGSYLRELIYNNNEWKKYVHQSVKEFIEKDEIKSRLDKLSKKSKIFSKLYKYDLLRL